nr:acyl--CoA ligase [Prevotella sp.]
MVLEDYLKTDCLKYPDKTAVICDNKSVTYSELYCLVEKKMTELIENGFSKGDIITFKSSQDIDFIITYFAIHLIGCVAVPLEKDIPDNRLKEINGKFDSCSIPDDVADILFTTGTTGKSKGVMISNSTIIADAENLIDAQGFSHDILFIICGPLNHIGCLSKIYPVIMCGATLLIMKGMKDINAFFTALDSPYEKIATFLVPANIRILISFGRKQLEHFADKIDFIETGAAPMAQSDMNELCKILPNTRLYNTYASTETGIISTYNYNDGNCIAGCLGRPMKHSQIIITENGTIACKGDTLMSGYVGDKQLTDSILHDNTIFTSDNGMIDNNGMLHLTGRMDDVINVGGMKVAPSEVENVALSLPFIKDCICISMVHPIMGSILKLLVVLKEGKSLDKKEIAKYINTKLETYKVPTAYEQVDKIERTFNGKINRKAYR